MNASNLCAYRVKYWTKKRTALGKIRQVKMATSRETIPMTTTIGIFDSAVDLDKAVERLARAGFEDIVYNEAIVGEEAINVAHARLCAGHCSGGGLG